MSNPFEEKARAILLSYGIDSDGDWPFSADGLAAAISVALLSVQRETREADAKIGYRIASLHSNPAIIEGAQQVATAIRSQGTDG